ncbi:MAG: cyclopropane-fatty-acyl-phospholipid synthase family protein [Alphaproteobacteria bacterium]|nr:cyclopropane-fatty-acyl-phospholipid synthase family protein [Alphaproteobacteria bacterium]
MLLELLFNHVMARGTLTAIDPGGAAARYGDGTAPAVTIRFHDRASQRRVVRNPQLGIPEAYMSGGLTIENGSIYDFLDLVGANLAVTGPNWIMRARDRLALMLRRLAQRNPIGRAQRNVAHHYDLSGEFYDLFLDSDRQYSCAYYDGPDDDLESAQEHKKRHIAAKLLVEPNHKVLDIGSGWGGLSLYLAAETGADVTGVTLSTEQHKVSQRRVAERGLDHKVRFHLRDYRQDTSIYDRIVSVGMFEHVGVGHYGEFFRKVRDSLAEDGVALIHTIGRIEEPGTTNPFIRKYIFPGGYVPAMSEVVSSIERTGLYVTDIEVLRLHYAETLRAWRTRFVASWDRAKALYDERFCRMWEYYLAASEVSFRHLGSVVFQFQLARRQDAVPLTRDYVTDWERDRSHRKSVAA